MRYPVNFIKIQAAGYHQGKALDFCRPSDNATPPVYACDAGTVYSVEKQTNGGNVIYLKHSNGWCSCYAHLSKVMVEEGDKVSLGQQIGKMGATGNVTGPHLHFALFTSPSVRYQDSTIDPLIYLYAYPDQMVDPNSNYYSDIKYKNDPEIKYVYNVDDEGLNVRSTPNGTKTGELLQTATEVKVYEISGSWSRIGTNKWVSSNYLSSNIPTHYKVTGADSEGLNVRNQPSTSGTILNTLPNGSKVQIYSTSGTWAKVSNSEARWCSKNYLTKV